MRGSGRDSSRRARIPRVPPSPGRDDLRDGWRALAAPSLLEGTPDGPPGVDRSRTIAQLWPRCWVAGGSTPVQTAQGSTHRIAARSVALGPGRPISPAGRLNVVRQPGDTDVQSVVVPMGVTRVPRRGARSIAASRDTASPRSHSISLESCCWRSGWRRRSRYVRTRRAARRTRSA